MNFLSDTLKRIRSDFRGARVLADWIGDGAHPVPQEVANTRAALCANCPGRNNRFEHRRVENSVAEAIRQQEGIRNKVQLRTPFDGRLLTCKECGCYLKLKVWVPIENQSDQEMPEYCWITKERAGLGAKKGAPIAKEPDKGTVVIERKDALGDVILASAIGTALHKQGYVVKMKCAVGLRELFNGHPHISIADDGDVSRVNLNGVWEREQNRGRIDRRQAYWNTAKSQLKPYGINLDGEMPTPVLHVLDHEKSDASIELLTLPRPFIAVNPRSNGWVNRQIPNSTWEKVAELVKGTKIWLGTTDAPKGFFDPKIRTIRRLMAFIAVSDKIVSPDTGPVHVAIALRIPTTIVTGPFRPEIMLPKSGTDGAKWNQVYPLIPCIGCGDYKCQLKAVTPPCVEVNPKMIADAISNG